MVRKSKSARRAQLGEVVAGGGHRAGVERHRWLMLPRKERGPGSSAQRKTRTKAKAAANAVDAAGAVDAAAYGEKQQQKLGTRRTKGNDKARKGGVLLRVVEFLMVERVATAEQALRVYVFCGRRFRRGVCPWRRWGRGG